MTTDNDGQLIVGGSVIGVPGGDVYEGVTIKDSLGSSVNLTVNLVERKY